MEKRCYKCRRLLPPDAFYRHAAMADGHFNKCKDCTRQDALDYRRKNREAIRRYDRMRSGMPHRIAIRKAYRQSAAGKQAQARSSKKQRTLHPEKFRARALVNHALRAGKLARLPCFECGKPAQAHHPDYSDPLGVVWLCPEHHREVHNMIGKKHGIPSPLLPPHAAARTRPVPAVPPDTRAGEKTAASGQPPSGGTPRSTVRSR